MYCIIAIDIGLKHFAYTVLDDYKLSFNCVEVNEKDKIKFIIDWFNDVVNNDKK